MQRLQLNKNSSVLPNGKTKSLSNETCLHSATNTKSSIPLFCYAVIAILNVFADESSFLHHDIWFLCKTNLEKVCPAV